MTKNLGLSKGNFIMLNPKKVHRKSSEITLFFLDHSDRMCDHLLVPTTEIYLLCDIFSHLPNIQQNQSIRFYNTTTTTTNSVTRIYLC